MTREEFFAITESENWNIESWRRVMAEYARTAKFFEIHCWNEETEEWQQALQYGEYSETDWRYGKVARGAVTEEFVRMLLETPKPTENIDLYDKMTPFFTVAFDNGLWSEHYGTEMNLSE